MSAMPLLDCARSNSIYTSSISKGLLGLIAYVNIKKYFKVNT